MDTNNSVLTALPSYVRYSRREIGKASKEDRRETAFSGIRQKLSSAVISVPYGGGLDNLRLIGNVDDHDFQNRYTAHKKPKRKKHKRENVLETEMYMSEGDIPHVKTQSRYFDQFSPAKLNFPSRKPARIGSETSTTSTATSKSRSTIYSTSENDEAFWAQKLKELDVVKERYSDNSEFLSSLYGYKLKKGKHRSSKKKKKKSKKHGKHDNHEEEITPEPIIDLSNRLKLPPLKQTHVDVGKSRESTLTNASDESNTSTIVANDENENSKRRRVEFDLHKSKRTIKLPPIEGKHSHEHHDHHEKHEHHGHHEKHDHHGHHEKDDHHDHHVKHEHERHKTKNPKRSILKKINNTKESTVNSFPSNVNVSSSTWHTHIRKLKSPPPIPSSASRRHQVTFKKSPFNLSYKCSKEFEAVATNYDSDRKASFLTD